jgi:hypothetical protein
LKPHAIFGALAITAALVSLAVQAQTAHDGVDRHHGDSQFPIEVLSSRPDAISGGDALIRVTVKKNVPASGVRIELNDIDVTSSFVVSANMLTGRVGGMRRGENLLEVIDPRGNVRGKGRADADIVLTNYPIEGPMFSGPHEQPFVCAPQQSTLTQLNNAWFAGLPVLLAAPAMDVNCHFPTRVDYLYRTNATPTALAIWPAGATAYPANLGTTADGKPYIVRLETGTINRAVYQIAMLHDPIAQPQAPAWNNVPANWNKRLIYTFGGGCIGGWYRQGTSTGGVTDNFMLSNGYALASSTLNVFGNNCNDLTASETMAMVKERFIEAYGPPAHTQGWGCSGGSYAQHQIGDNYPGLLEGIIPGCSFPEVGFATINFITDAWLLDDYFTARQAAMGWSDEQKRRVTGFLVYNTAPNIEVGAHRIDPRPGTTSCAAVPLAQRYDPATNPTGVRCTVHDHTVNVYGRDPANGFTRRPLDNTGIQYGLKVLNDAGTNGISVDQFLDLNERIGGFDADANQVPQRTVADLIAARAAYQTGRLTNGGGGLASIPIIDFRDYNDALTGGDIHVRYHSFSMRKRLDKANGHHRNHVMVAASTATTTRCCGRRSSRWIAGSPRSRPTRATSRRSRRSSRTGPPTCRKDATRAIHPRSSSRRRSSASRTRRRAAARSIPPTRSRARSPVPTSRPTSSSASSSRSTRRTTRSPSARHSGRGCRRSSRPAYATGPSPGSSSRTRSARGCSSIRGENHECALHERCGRALRPAVRLFTDHGGGADGLRKPRWPQPARYQDHVRRRRSGRDF